MKEKDLKLSVSVTSVKSKPTSVIDAVLDNLGIEETVKDNKNQEIYEEAEAAKSIERNTGSTAEFERFEEPIKKNRTDKPQKKISAPVQEPITQVEPEKKQHGINAPVIFSACAFAISMVALGVTLSMQIKESPVQKFEKLSTELELVKRENLNLSKDYDTLLLKLEGFEKMTDNQYQGLNIKLNNTNNQIVNLDDRVSKVDSMLNELARSDFVSEKTLTEAIKLFASQTTLNSKEYSDGLNDKLREDLSKRHDLLVKQLGVMLAEVLTDTEHREREISTLKRKADKLTSHFK